MPGFPLESLCLAETSGDVTILIVVGAVILLALVCAPAVRKSVRTGQLTGPVAITFEPGAPRLGETCRARVTIRPQGPVVVEAVDVEIQAFEQVRWKVRTNNRDQIRSKVESVWYLRIPTRRPGQVIPPQVVEEAFEFTIPSEGPPSFEAPMNRLMWTVTLTIRMRGLNATRKVYPITVPPIRLVA
jgi:hypothetical protein